MENDILTVHKVTAFILRRGKAGVELLVFDHPAAGIQLPAGTVERGERPAQAAMREAQEETGILSLRRLGWLGAAFEPLPPDIAILDDASRLRVAPRLDAPLVVHPLHRGFRVDVGEVQAGFRHIRYREEDLNTTPPRLLWAVEGWLPEECLAQRARRHFHLFECLEETPPRWEVISDLEYCFRPHWEPLDPPPALIPPQAGWLRWLRTPRAAVWISKLQML